MFSRSSSLVFLAISLCVQAVPHFRREQCNTISTVVQTVTVMAHAPATTSGRTNSGSRVADAVNKGTDNDATTTSLISFATPTPDTGNNDDNNPSKTTVATATMRHNDNANKDGHGSTTARASSTNTASTATSKSSAAGVGNKTGKNNSDPQTSLTLDSHVIATGFAKDGQDVPAAGQVSSLTSTNNFINFCLTVPNLNITNGRQITAGSCNPAPMGLIPSTSNMPSSKFTFPKNFGTLKANQTFTIQMAIQNMQTGFFVNAEENYFAAPQQLNAQGQIQGHSHVVIEELSSLDQTTPTNPKKFVFFKGLNDAAVNGILKATVPNGLNVGFYKLSSINSAANHQPVLVAIAQRGSLDDAIYFSVTSDGVPVSNNEKGTAPVTNAGKSGAAHAQASTTTRAAVVIPSSTSPASMKEKRRLRNRFALKF